MINANKDTLNSFFSSNLQFVVPFFQRSYVWDEENWDILWDHVERTATAITENRPKEHFIGTLITKQREAQALGENRLDLIDGQQRLTTFAIFLKAMANTASGEEPYTNLAKMLNELITFEDARGVNHKRIEHSKNDKQYFDAVMDGVGMGDLPNSSHKIIRCYEYFEGKLRGFADDQLDILKSIVLNNVPVISMLLSASDDEQEIFDTLNSLGVRLTTGELLKNYIFSDPAIRPYYDTLWEPVFEDDEDQIEFWNRTKTSGRFSRTNIEVLLYCYLVIQRKAPVELDRLFKEYKVWLRGKDLSERVLVLEEIKELAEIYYGLPEGLELNEIRFSDHINRFFHVMENLDITTVYPLVLFIFSKVEDESERITMLRILESYIIRRQVVRLTTKNYNNLFVQIMKNLDESGDVSSAKLEELLSAYIDDGNRTPIDEEFIRAFSEQPISNTNAREVLFCLALHQVHNPKNDIQKLSASSFTVEHMMPKKWEEHWNLENMNEMDKIERNRKIQTLGNLTLVTGSLNSSMRNAAWKSKRMSLGNHSMLKLTTDYLEIADWNETEIKSRAEDLSQVAIQIWQ